MFVLNCELKWQDIVCRLCGIVTDRVVTILWFKNITDVDYLTYLIVLQFLSVLQ